MRKRELRDEFAGSRFYFGGGDFCLRRRSMNATDIFRYHRHACCRRMHAGRDFLGDRSLLLYGSGDAGCDLIYFTDHLTYRGNRGGCVAGAVLNRRDLGRNICRGLGRSARECLYLCRDERESLARFSCPGGLDRCVQSEQIGLLRDRVDEVQDLADPVSRNGEGRDDCIRPGTLIDRFSGDLCCIAGPPAYLLHRRNEFLGGRGNRLDVSCGLGRGTDSAFRLIRRAFDGGRDQRQIIVDAQLELRFTYPRLNLLRDVDAKLNDFIGPPRRVENGIVGGLQPNLMAIFADTLVFRGLVFATAEPLPEGAVFFGLLLRGIDEQPAWDRSSASTLALASLL